MIVEGIVGVVTGLLGNALTSFTNLKMQKLKNEHDVRMIEAETKAMIAEVEANIKITETKIQGELDLMEEKNYGEGLRVGNKQALDSKVLNRLFESNWTAWLGSIIAFLLGIVDFLRSAMRPTLTAYLVFLTSWLTYEAVQIIRLQGDLITAIQAQGIFTQVSNIVLYLTVSCVTWWFADRRTAKFIYRLNDGNSK